jgi:DNA-binding HxlR family transcriptional regulator
MEPTDEAVELQRIAVLERRGAVEDRDEWMAEGWCRIERSLELIGTRSAMILLREVFYGGARFEDLVRRTGLSEAVAAGRLKELVRHDVLDRRPYREPGSRTRHEYVLTERGASCCRCW